MSELDNGGGHRVVLLGMLLVQAIATGLQLLSKVILGHGTFVFALLTYRHIVATFCVAPVALFRERESLKNLNVGVVVHLFFVALFGIPMAMGLFYYGLRDTTATYATNFLNLIPIATFILSLIFRIEKLRWNHKDGKVKIIGAVFCLAGALTTTFYKGKTFYLSNAHSHQLVSNQMNENWGRGTVFLTFSCLSYGLWFVTQGVLASAATLCLVFWAIAKRGPTYPSMFNPLSLVFVAITEAIFFGTSISFGSLIGMAVLIVGFYLFLWGKSMEKKGEAAG
ncbi:hypothetical protein DM860_015335 [Cuscuta australis]|uniref:WAT1-related protein n=1 Tax=Cuscuta australis TaxID=267555 RepID=A0A328DKW3_9ASTE|nr:hypothetical protein DM860_015335 [Cuscuta australis]